MKRITLAVLLSLAACGPADEPTPSAQHESPLELVAVVFCDAQVSVNGQSFWAEHATHYFSDGSLMATCSIHDAEREYTSVSTYRSSMPGANNGECLLTYDVDDKTGGLWRFTSAPGGQGGIISSGVYVDGSSDFHGHAAALTCVIY